MNLFKLPLIRRVYTFIYLFICSCICLFFLFILSFIYSFLILLLYIHSLIILFIYLFVYDLCFPFTFKCYISVKGLLASTDERRIRRAGELRVGKSPIAVSVRSTFLSTDRDPGTNLSQI